MDRIADNTLALARHAKRLTGAGRSGSSAPFSLALFTDKRAGDPVGIVSRLPHRYALPGGVRLAVIFRHYGTPDRRALAEAVAAAVRARGHLLLIAGDPALARQCRADGVHLPEHRAAHIPGLKRAHPLRIVSAACHGLPALITAQRAGADCAFLSPVFATQSHPGAETIAPLKAHGMVSRLEMPVLALGGIDCHTAASLRADIFSGLGAIDGFTK